MLIALRHHETAQIIRLGDGGGETDTGQFGRDSKQARQTKRQQVAAFRGDERVQLVEDDTAEASKQIRRIGRGKKERELFRRGEQHVRRMTTLALAF